MQAKPRSATLTRRNASWHEATQHRNGNNHAKRPPAMRCGHPTMSNDLRHNENGTWLKTPAMTEL